MTKERILVVDDDALVIRLVETTLSRGGYEVLVARDGREGLDSAMGEHPDLIVTDIMMPVMDGFEFTRRIRAESTIKTTPIIMLSAKSEDEDIIKGLEIGADEYVTKPFSPRDLLARIGSMLERKKRAIKISEPSSKGPFSETGLDHLAKFRFENFVIGPSNQAAFDAARIAAAEPGFKFNPLFIYGGPGLGKTHLMCALANETYERNPEIKALYLTSEAFSQQVLDSYQNNEMTELMAVYLSSDVIVIDDIQFLAISPSLQGVASDLLSQLYQSGKQIVISSDRSPAELATISEGISADLAFGRIVSLGDPDESLRAEIIKSKAESRKWPLDEDLIDYLAAAMPTDIRSLEGAAARLAAMKLLGGFTPDKNTVDRLVREIMPSPRMKALETDEGISEATETYDKSIQPEPVSALRSGTEYREPTTTDDGDESEASTERTGRLPDPLVMEFGRNHPLTRIHGDQNDVALNLPPRTVRPIIVLGTTSTLVLDTVEALVGVNEPPHQLSQEDHWAYLVHTAVKEPGWLVLGLSKWESKNDLAGAIIGRYLPVFVVVLDSMSPKIIEARKLISMVPDDVRMVVAVLVSATDDRLEDARRTLSKSLRRLFRVPEHVPVAIAGSVNTHDCRTWIRMALE